MKRVKLKSSGELKKRASVHLRNYLHLILMFLQVPISALF